MRIGELLHVGTLLITGGAGFIGSNLVHYALAHTADRLVVLDKLTYAGSLLNLDAPLQGSARAVRRGRYRGRRRWSRASSPSIGRTAVLNLAAETHVDRSIDGPRPFIDTNIVGTFVLLEAARAFVAGLDAGGARRVPLPARLDRRGLRHARRERPVQRGDAVRAELAVRGQQGGGGSPGARELSHLRPAGR